ncbi:hypothetical protein [Grimontia marina]|uniref:Uncharacterized protein n=1 Tax=Grimontia marina TaxID=646534 RepID=A0A128FJG8_9GAMM|nr:hypothetical protein [Grimontia marina]CZF86949.1 hypothetical protein GMA8713_04990 [Grimontia marina]
MRNLLFLLLCFSTYSYGYTSVSGPVKINSLRVYDSGKVLFKAPGATNKENCKGADSWIYLKQETEAQKRQFTVLLSARMSDMPVTLFFNGCSGGGQSGYRVVEQVML